MKRSPDFRQLSKIYLETTDAITQIVGKEISGRFDQAGNPPEISTLFYEAVVSAIARSATDALGDDSARAILRRVARAL